MPAYIPYTGDHIYTQKYLFEILLIQPEIRLYLPFHNYNQKYKWNKTLANLITYGVVYFFKYVYGCVSKNVTELLGDWIELETCGFH